MFIPDILLSYAFLHILLFVGFSVFKGAGSEVRVLPCLICFLASGNDGRLSFQNEVLTSTYLPNEPFISYIHRFIILSQLSSLILWRCVLHCQYFFSVLRDESELMPPRNSCM